MANLYRQLEANQRRRMASEARMLERWDDLSKREEEAEAMIGQVMRNGQIVYYVWPQGGRYREGTRGDLIAFLFRNKYA